MSTNVSLLDIQQRKPELPETKKIVTTVIMTNLTAGEKMLIEDPGDAKYFGITIGFLVFFLGTIGNGITVWAYMRNKNLQTSFNVLIANLCLIELMFSFIVIPVLLPGYFAGKDIYPEAFCTTVGYFYYTSLAASLYNLVAIAINRYVGIVKPERYQKLFTGPRLTLCILSVWIVPHVLYIPVAVGHSIYWQNSVLRCSIGIAAKVPRAIKFYNLGLNVTFQAVPLVILIVLYTAIFRKVKKVKEQMKKHLRPYKKTSSKISRDISLTSNTTIKNKSGNTSDDTGDEFKPSSLVEGIGFKPVHHSSEHQYDSSPISDETPKPDSKDDAETHFINDHPNNSAPTLSYQSEDEKKEKMPPRKRNSIWTLLIRNKQSVHLNKIPAEAENLRSPTVSISTDQPLSDDEYSISHSLQQNHKPTNVILRSESKRLTQIHRKRSLSAPTLPNLNVIESETKLSDLRSSPIPSRKYFDTAGKNNKFHTHGNESDNEPYMSRSKSAYVKRKKRGRTLSDTEPRKSKIASSVRVKRTTKDFTSSLSLHEGSDNESGARARLATIARKVQDKKAKREKAEKLDKRQKQRQRMQRRKHARERQLVYSSFAICIAFAVCIMPTALLYLYQVSFRASVDASIILIVSNIAWLHCIVNPVIYGYLNSQYRREYNKIFNNFKSKILPKSKYIPSRTKTG